MFNTKVLFTEVIKAYLFIKNICKLNKYVKKRNYFVFIIHQLNKHDVKHFKSGALRTITNVTRSMKKVIPSQLYLKDFVHKYKTAF